MSELRLDYLIECENCGTVEDVPAFLSEQAGRQSLRDQGWRSVDDENRCPSCANVDTDNKPDPMLVQLNPPPED